MSSCSCIYIDPDSTPEFITEKIRKAMKVHECSECGREIKQGEKYEYVSGCWEGNFSTYKTCIDCLSIRAAFFCECHAFGEIIADLWESLHASNGEVSEKCMSELTPGAKEKVFEIIEKIWKELEDE